MVTSSQVAPPYDPRGSGGRDFRLLIVEDNPAHVLLLRELLAQIADLRFKTAHVERLGSAIQLLEQQQFDLILLDLNLPDAQGYHVVAAVHSSAAHTPIIVLSAGGERSIDLAALRHGAQDYLAKDHLDPDTLERSILYALTRSHADALERMDAVVQAADAAIYGIDLQDRVADWNRAAERLYGYSREEATGQPIGSLNHAIQPNELQYLLDRTRAGEHVDGYETTHLTSEGRLIDLALTAAPIRNISGAVVGSSIIARDVSERKRAEEALRQSEERLRLMIESVEDYAIYMLDPGGHIASWNAGARRIKGYSAAEVIGRHFSTFYTAEDRARNLPQRLLQTATATGRASAEGWRVRKDGTRLWASVVLSAVRDETGNLLGFVKVTRDMSERKQAEEALRESEERYHALFEHSLDAIILTRPDGRILAANPTATQMFGVSEATLIRLGRDAIVDISDPRLRKWIAEDPLDGPTQGELMMRRGDGSLFPAEIRAIGFLDRAGTPHISMFIHDITEQKKTTEELTYRAFYDPLTRLPNRALFMDRLSRQVEHFKRDKSHLFAVLFIDLDRFKLINDSLGHAAGDLLLSEIGGRLKECVRVNDTVARLGGDEFSVLLDGIDQLKAATLTADRIQALLQQPFLLAGHEVFATASVGIAISTAAYNSAEELLRDADTAMYRAKSAGKARYVVFDEAMHRAAMQTLELELALRRAVDRAEFVVYYQPILSLLSGQVEGFEALVRWQRGPEGEIVSPRDFVPLAEETGLILAIDWWVLREACRRLKAEHQRAGGGSRHWVSVNFSAKQFADPNLVARIEQTLREVDLAPEFLRLEITESAFVEDEPHLEHTFAQLRALGVQIDLDDFGTGYASLSYLYRFRVDALKVDQSFVRSLVEPGAGSEIVRATITLAHSMGLHVVAEGVQTPEQWDLLRLLHCDRAQGYYLAMPAADMLFETPVASSQLPVGSSQ